MKNILLIGFAVLIANIGFSQNADPAINILMQPASVSQYTTGILRVDACNPGFTPIVSNSLRITISVGPNAEIIGLKAGDTDSRWTITSLTPGNNNTAFLVNTAGTIGSGNCGIINLIVKGKVVSGAATITGNITYIVAANPLLGGAQNATQGNSNTANDNSTTSLTVTTFLPIKLESFHGNMVNCNTVLDWTTSSEDNLKNYEVEYSTNGSTFVGVGTVSAKGYNGGGSTYSFTHTPKNGTAYYRLKSIDNNTSFAYSNVINVTRSCDKRIVNIYPNPTSENLIVTIDNPIYDAGNTEIGILYNAAGKEVKRFVFQNGTNNIDVSKFASGIYVMKIVSKDGNENYQLIIE